MPSSPRTSHKDYPTHNVKTIHPHDVVCGRGLGMKHVGNHLWRQLIRDNMDQYGNLPRAQRQIVTNSIVLAVRSLSPPGRFLMLDTKTRSYYDIGNAQANLKTAQAMRDAKKKSAAESGGDRRDSGYSSAGSSQEIPGQMSAQSASMDPLDPLDPLDIASTRSLAVDMPQMVSFVETNSSLYEPMPLYCDYNGTPPSFPSLTTLPSTPMNDGFNVIDDETLQQNSEPIPLHAYMKPATVTRNYSDDESISSMGITEHEWACLLSEEPSFHENGDDPLLGKSFNTISYQQGADLLLQSFDA